MAVAHGTLTPGDRAFLASLGPATPTRYHALNPLTKATLAIIAMLGAFVLGGYVAPIAIFAVLTDAPRHQLIDEEKRAAAFNLHGRALVVP